MGSLGQIVVEMFQKPSLEIDINSVQAQTNFNICIRQKE